MSSMIDLHVLPTKFRTKASVPIGTPTPMKPSGQKETRETSSRSWVKAGLLLMMLCAASNTVCCVTPLGRTEVLETLSSRPASSLSTSFSSANTCKIADALLKKGSHQHTDGWDTCAKAWVHMTLHLSHTEGGFGVTFNDVTKDSTFYTSTSRFVAWLGAFSKERQGLWLPKDDLKDPSPLPLLCLRDIHSKLLSNYNCKESSSQSQVNVGASGGLRFQDGGFQQEETAPLSIPQLNHLFEDSFVWDESSASNAVVTVIPSQHRVTQQILVVFSSQLKSKCGNILTKTVSLRIILNIYRRRTCNVKITLSPVTLANLSSINLVSNFRCSSPPWNPVYVRCVDPSALAFSLSSHRHSYLSLLFCTRFID